MKFVCIGLFIVLVSLWAENLYHPLRFLPAEMPLYSNKNKKLALTNETFIKFVLNLLKTEGNAFLMRCKNSIF
ncbi:hypothetical protein FK004_00405 [Flavobacterium kingsejongi]|uniref:Uncharacterized protein n=1 Tax=Flavobacterium kingsejongi TaxID=1678728 RepID=A0A2S1LJ33_9FLAO|nr:hypothetical protein FK004_00405 [Flavobacterium kingsejongi]